MGQFPAPTCPLCISGVADAFGSSRPHPQVHLPRTFTHTSCWKCPLPGSVLLASHTQALLGHPGAHQASHQLQFPVPQVDTSRSLSHSFQSPWGRGPPLPTAVASCGFFPETLSCLLHSCFLASPPQINSPHPSVHPGLHLRRTQTKARH